MSGTEMNAHADREEAAAAMAPIQQQVDYPEDQIMRYSSNEAGELLDNYTASITYPLTNDQVDSMDGYLLHPHKTSQADDMLTLAEDPFQFVDLFEDADATQVASNKALDAGIFGDDVIVDLHNQGTQIEWDREHEEKLDKAFRDLDAFLSSADDGRTFSQFAEQEFASSSDTRPITQTQRAPPPPPIMTQPRRRRQQPILNTPPRRSPRNMKENQGMQIGPSSSLTDPNVDHEIRPGSIEEGFLGAINVPTRGQSLDPRLNQTQLGPHFSDLNTHPTTEVTRQIPKSTPRRKSKAPATSSPRISKPKKRNSRATIKNYLEDLAKANADKAQEDIDTSVPDAIPPQMSPSQGQIVHPGQSDLVFRNSFADLALERTAHDHLGYQYPDPTSYALAGPSTHGDLGEIPSPCLHRQPVAPPFQQGHPMPLPKVNSHGWSHAQLQAGLTSSSYDRGPLALVPLIPESCGPRQLPLQPPVLSIARPSRTAPSHHTGRPICTVQTPEVQRRNAARRARYRASLSGERRRLYDASAPPATN